MHIVITHSSPVTLVNLRARLRREEPDFHCASSSSLTQTYNYAEHHQPDCVLIAQALALRPEFELLASLFKLMETGCVILVSQPHGAKPVFEAKDIACIHEDASASDLSAAITQAVFIAKRKKPLTREPAMLPAQRYDPRKVMLIGSSTGGVDAICQVIGHFSSNCPPTLIVQHTGGRYAKSLIRLLDGATDAKVSEAQDGQSLRAGQIYLAPDDAAHLTLSTSASLRIKLRNEPLVSGHRPSIDTLFHSAVPSATHVTAALLTGMGRDGAEGLLALRRAGAQTFGQDEATSVVYGMPRTAMEIGAVDRQLPIQQIGPAMLRSCHAKARV